MCNVHSETVHLLLIIFYRITLGNQDTKPTSQWHRTDQWILQRFSPCMQTTVWTIPEYIYFISPPRKRRPLFGLTVGCPALITLSTVIWLVAGNGGYAWAPDETKCCQLSRWQPRISWRTKSSLTWLGEIWLCSIWTWAFLKINWKKEKERILY